MHLIDDFEALRGRGAKMRERAEKSLIPEIKQALSRIAADYEILATRAEERFAIIARRVDDRAKAEAAVSGE